MMVLILGILGGPSFAVFGTGIFLPFVNRRGIIVGFILGAGETSCTLLVKTYVLYIIHFTLNLIYPLQAITPCTINY